MWAGIVNWVENASHLRLVEVVSGAKILEADLGSKYEKFRHTRDAIMMFRTSTLERRPINSHCRT